jgi:hypothetical protein
MRILHLTSFCLSLAACACSAASEPAEAEPLESLAAPLTDEQYVDARSYFTEPEDIDAWYSLTSALKADFDHICGDTFCEGDYSNFESLGFRCSVAERSGIIGRCVWVFAASTDEINAATGNVKVHGEIWRCRMPLVADTSASDFMRALSASGEQPLYALLPGGERSLYDGLVDCL